MVRAEKLTKKFEGKAAVDRLNLNVKKGSIYGLVGVNGSGKTTVIKHLAGVYKADSGTVTMEDKGIYDNPAAKARIGYVADELYFFNGYCLKSLAGFYGRLYKTFSKERFRHLVELMGLDEKRRVTKFSKGMQKQAAIALSLSTMPDFLLLDEPIDGLDPIVRKKVFEEIIDDVAARQMTVLISSHNLKEMDGICDTIGIIKDGKMLLEQELDELKAGMQKTLAADSRRGEPSLDEIFIHVYENGGTNND